MHKKSLKFQSVIFWEILSNCWAKRKGCFDTWSEIFPFYGSIIFKEIAYCGGRGNLHFIPKRSGKNPLRRPCLTRIYFLQRTRINIKRKLRNLILLVNSFWHNIMVLHTHDLMQSEHEKNTAAKQKRPFFLFPSFLIFHAIQSSLYVKDYDKEQTTTSRVVCFSNHSTVLENHQKCLTFISGTYFMDPLLWWHWF